MMTTPRDPHHPSAFAALGRRSRRIAAAIRDHGIPRPRRRSPGFATLARIIVGQQVSAKAAASIWRRVEETAGGTVSPASILTIGPQGLRAAGLSRQKCGYLLHLAEAVASGGFDPCALAGLDDEAATVAITALPGFGVWSAKMYLIFALARPDVWPVEDLGVRAGLARIFHRDTRPEPADAEKLGAAFRPLRSTLALLCWHVLHNEPA